MERDAVIVVAAVIPESKPAGPLASGTPLSGIVCLHPKIASGTPLSGTGHCLHPKILSENQTTNQPYYKLYDLI